MKLFRAVKAYRNCRYTTSIKRPTINIVISAPANRVRQLGGHVDTCETRALKHYSWETGKFEFFRQI